MAYRRASVWIVILLLAASVLHAGASWKPTIVFPDDPYAVPSGTGQAGWIKFTILLDDPSTVLFQDSNAYPFHYGFATAELPPPFAGMSPSEFDAVTLHEQGQLAVLGAVILPPLVGYDHAWQEYGIQFVRQDAYAPETLRDLFWLVESKVVAGPQVQAYYFPTFDQQASAIENQSWFESEGIFLGSTDRWAAGNDCYSLGWALGDLKYVPGNLIDLAYLAGTLGPEDILLTDSVPAEIPFVAGVVTLSPSTPSSHVALLAETFGIPFAHLAVADDAARAQALAGGKIVLRLERDFGFDSSGCLVKLIDVEGILAPATVAEIQALKDPPPLDIVAMSPLGSYSASLDGLTPADVLHFGGKAAHFGLLRQAIPSDSPVGTALSFDLWISFLDQTLPGSGNLRQEILSLLAPYTWPPNFSQIDATLYDVRELIKDDGETVFDPAAAAAVLSTLQDVQYGFDPQAKIRFRSSTNVEDTDRFTGAGLYDSFSGCLADDLDGDAIGPSHCDAGEPSERGVFRAIRKVFASFYNFNAYLERLRHGVNETEVGMAVLAHHSFPDELELANGVATLEQTGSPSNRSAYIVSQDGAESVTNPEPGSIAEEVDVYIYSGGSSVWPTLMQQSNRVPLGATVMDFPDDYVDLTNLLQAVAGAYQAATGRATFELEFEFKKMAPGDALVVKQVRPVPRADTTPSVTPFLINEPTEYCTFQGEYGDVFANHRLKGRWSAETLNLWLTPANLASSLFDDSPLEYAETCQLYTQDGAPESWPDAGHLLDGDDVVDLWSFSSLQNPRTYRLTVPDVPSLVAPADSPLFVLDDFGWEADYTGNGCLPLEVSYESAVPLIDWTGPTTTTTDYVLLCPCPVSQVGELLQERTLATAGVTVETTFYWPPEAPVAAGYTAPLVRWVETTITGLISTPIVLDSEYSQTYRPEHHNFGENFLFEPALEPDLPAGQLAELTAAGVRALHVAVGGVDDVFTLYDDTAWGGACLGCTGFDGDGDGRCTGEPTWDCDDARSDVWDTPSEAGDLVFDAADHMSWVAPASPGGEAVVYDALRTSDAADFAIGAICVATGASTPGAIDGAEPAAGSAYYYLARARNDCPSGAGTLGASSEGVERIGRSCP